MKKKIILTEKEVKHVANLACLHPTPTELKKFQKQLSDTISYVEKLKKLNTESVPPTSQVTGLENIFREDKVKPSMSQEEVLSDAKEVYKGFFKVKAIF